MGEIAGVNMVKAGGCLLSLKTRARWVERFYNELNGHVLDWRGMGSVRLYLACDSPYEYDDRTANSCVDKVETSLE